jgi:hypothetical protein
VRYIGTDKAPTLFHPKPYLETQYNFSQLLFFF